MLNFPVKNDKNYNITTKNRFDKVPMSLKCVENVIIQHKYDTHKGIYFLILDNCVVYVGKSINTILRIEYHKSECVKKFDNHYILPCNHLTEKQIENLEGHFINFLKPKYNRTKGSKYTTKKKLTEIIERYSF